MKFVESEWEEIASLKIEPPKAPHHHLTDEIVRYVFDNLGISAERKVSIQHDAFKTGKTLTFIENDDKMVLPIYACCSDVGGSKLMVVSVKMDDEAFVLVRLDKCPLYGAYLGKECMVGVWSKDRWVKGSMFIQASFLAGMEQMREISTPFDKVSDLGDLYDALKRLMEFVDAGG